ncbi:hypothetical protein TorRG33x02_106300 [Trema orientale]|uniref:Uncharacterized protein n=1 Tax=Trema orientale TaxID=63057 RepID=A0A2P5F7B0_TREOI|nr:hypothetical protein TorRG33x02_106300 [Trema orientale]
MFYSQMKQQGPLPLTYDIIHYTPNIIQNNTLFRKSILTIDSSHGIERIGFHTGYTKTIILSKNKTALNCQTFCYIKIKRSSLFCHYCPHNRSLPYHLELQRLFQ